jgi:hypothetical protein
MKKLADIVSDFEVVEVASHGSLQAFGLRGKPARSVDYLTMDEALDTQVLVVTEVDAGGHVPELAVENSGKTFVFLMAGEQLVGAKQNRILNASLLVNRRTRMVAPVSCVEQGRWSYSSRTFRSSGSSSHARLRGVLSKGAIRSYRQSQSPDSDQGQVWCEVSTKLRSLGSRSGSEALEQAYADQARRLDDLVGALDVPEDCCGVVFAIDGEIAGADIFDKPATLAKLLPKVARAYALDAIEVDSEDRISASDVTAWLDAASLTPLERFRSPGLGDDYRFESDDHIGAALVYKKQPIHVELFPSEVTW